MKIDCTKLRTLKTIVFSTPIPVCTSPLNLYNRSIHGYLVLLKDGQTEVTKFYIEVDKALLIMTPLHFGNFEGNIISRSTIYYSTYLLMK